MKPGIDAIDEKIMELVQENARTTIKEIAAEVFLSSPAVTTRIEKLEEKGYIRGYHASVDSEMLGYRIKAFIQLDLEPIQKEIFYKYIEDVPNVVECDCITGEYAILLQVKYPSSEELDCFINELQTYGRTNTQIVFSTVVDHRGMPIVTTP